MCLVRRGNRELLVVEQAQELGDEDSKVAREQEQFEVSVVQEDEAEEQTLAAAAAAAAVLNAKSERPSRPATSMQNSRHS